MSLIFPAGWPLDYWGSEEWFDVNTRLDALERDGIPYNPVRVNLLRSLQLCSLDGVNVAIFGQDPYPNPSYAKTGVAFSCGYPGDTGNTPASLRILFSEYTSDLGYPRPSTGCLESWCDEGVFLWNVTPTIEIERTDTGWKTHTHRHWQEWPPLTKEIIKKISDKGECVFVFFGKRAGEYAKYVRTDNNINTVMVFVHPSPLERNALWASKIKGSRLFSTVNDKLITVHNKPPINWRLK